MPPTATLSAAHTPGGRRTLAHAGNKRRHTCMRGGEVGVPAHTMYCENSNTYWENTAAAHRSVHNILVGSHAYNELVEIHPYGDTRFAIEYEGIDK